MNGFVNFALIRSIKKAIIAKVIRQYVFDTEEEERHLSELERRTKAMDEVEVYVITKTFIENHREVFVRSLEYISKQEGEKHE